MDRDVDVVAAARSLLSRANALMAKVNELKSSQKIQNLERFAASIKSEKKFLERLLSNSDSISCSHVRCTNLVYLEAIMAYITQTRTKAEAVSAVMKVFHYSSGMEKKRLRVDVVEASFMSWCKIRAGTLNYDEEDDEDDEDDEDACDDDYDLGDDGPDKFGDFEVPKGAAVRGAKDQPMHPILKQAAELIAAASQNQVHFKIPKVKYVFLGKASLDERLLDPLEELGIVVELRPNEPTSTPGDSDSDMRSSSDALTSTLMLDVTSLIALVSDITNDIDSIPPQSFDIEPLRVQAMQERKSPLLPKLLPILVNAERLLVTRSAAEKFSSIACIIGGPRELGRARALFNELNVPVRLASVEIPESIRTTAFAKLFGRVDVVPDDPSHEFVSDLGSTMSQLNMIVFGTSAQLRVSTITSNSHLVRSLGRHGLNSFNHEARSLIEARKNRART